METTEVFERGQKFINSNSLSIYFTSARGDDQVQVHLEKQFHAAFDGVNKN